MDDNDVNRIFSENLGVPTDTSRGTTDESKLTTDISVGANPPPKIAGIGRLDTSADTSQDAGSGRIAAIGKFLLDQKDLDKIGKLTNSDFNDGKMRVLTCSTT